MTPSVNCMCLQFDRPLSLACAIVRLALFCALLGGLHNASSAQNVQGLPAVGSGTGQKSSQMFIDATQFGLVTDDMCTKIADACGKLGTANYPLGATIDARGFTGNQVCAAANITTMLNGCVSQYSGTRNATGSKLLLGEVNLYADGPSGGVNGNYTDGTSGIGTPALIIPYGVWGIEGMTRGAQGGTTATPGTLLSVCTGPGTPITGCLNSFPVRKFTVNSATVSTTSGVTTMTMNVSPAPNWGVNIYPGELVMMKGNTSPASENGTYKVQNNSPDTTVKVTVPSTTPGCSAPFGSCGTLYSGTPILGFGPAGAEPNGHPHYYNTPNCSPNNPCAAFGMHIQNLSFNCQGGGTQPSGDIEGCMGWQNLYAEEESGADTFLINNFNFVGFDSHGNNAQNFGPISNAEVSTGTSNGNCDYGTTGAYIDEISSDASPSECLDCLRKSCAKTMAS
jgi:hypothetical protein